MFMSVFWGVLEYGCSRQAGRQAALGSVLVPSPGLTQLSAAYIPNSTAAYTHPQSCALQNPEPPVLDLYCCSSRTGSPTWSGPTP